MDRKKLLVGAFAVVVGGMAAKVFKTILEKEVEIEDEIRNEETIEG